MNSSVWAVWAAQGSKEKKVDLSFSEQLLRVFFSTFCGQIFFFNLKKKFLPTKCWKNHPQKLLRKTQIHFFFPYCPELPKRPKQKNSSSKLWLIDQPYIELGNIPIWSLNFWIVFSWNFLKLEHSEGTVLARRTT